MNLRSVRILLSGIVARTARLLVRLHPVVRHRRAVKAATRILVKVHGGFGDIIMCTPALRALRCGHPDAYIVCMTGKTYMPLLDQCPYIDELVAVERDALSLFGLVARLASYHFDFSVELTCYTTILSRYVPLMAGIERRFGPQIINKWHYPVGYSNPVPMPTEGTQIARFMQVAIAAGGIADGEQIECYVTSASRELVSHVLGPADSRPLIIVHPSCQTNHLRRWPARSFAEVIDSLQADQPARFLLIGTAEDLPLVNHIAAECRTPVEVLASALDLGGLQALIERVDLLVCNNSGPMHMAIALGTPVVAVFGPTDPDFFVGTNPPAWCRLFRASVECLPPAECCVYASMSEERRSQVLPMCSQPNEVCTDAVSVQPVLASARDLLECRNASRGAEPSATTAHPESPKPILRRRRDQS